LKALLTKQEKEKPQKWRFFSKIEENLTTPIFTGEIPKNKTKH